MSRILIVDDEPTVLDVLAALLASVREHTPALPVIVMSAVDRQQARHREVFRTDYTVFLRKPFDIETLLTLVERLTGSQPR